jgi:hypothetical protein
MKPLRVPKMGGGVIWDHAEEAGKCCEPEAVLAG